MENEKEIKRIKADLLKKREMIDTTLKVIDKLESGEADLNDAAAMLQVLQLIKDLNKGVKK